jgi:hypothetical protein
MIMDPYHELTLYQRPAMLMAAAKLGVFASLADGSATPSEVAHRVLAPVDAISRLLTALASLDYLSRDGEHFALNDFSKTFIRDGAGGMVRLAWKEHLFYAAWSRLADAISSGNALFLSFADRLTKDFDSVEKFLLALNDLAQMAAPGVIGTGAFDGATTILDLGCGGGGYAAELALALPGARVTLADLREIINSATGWSLRPPICSATAATLAGGLSIACFCPMFCTILTRQLRPPSWHAPPAWFEPAASLSS